MPRDAETKGRIVQGTYRSGTHRQRDALFGNTTVDNEMVEDTTVVDTTVGDELTLHKKYYFNKATRQLAMCTLYQYTVQGTVSVTFSWKTPWVIFY